MKLTCIIIDDEPEVRQLLTTYLLKYCSTVQVLGEAGDVETAYRLISELEPDVIFLDVSMPGDDGFQLLERFNQRDFEVIFVTAYERYALPALKVSAIDYLLKPIDIAELQKAVMKAMDRFKNKSVVENLELFKEAHINKKSTKLALPVTNGLRLVNINDIVRCEALSNYTSFHFINQKELLVTQTMKEYAEHLEKNGFIRVHRSHLVNLAHIIEYNREGNLIMSDGSHIEVSIRQRPDLITRLRGL
ncbi:MAG: LytTR family DNA-binding domain-containing protein [Chitinophagales bacterium]